MKATAAPLRLNMMINKRRLLSLLSFLQSLLLQIISNQKINYTGYKQ